eukprot:68746-Karenia_brevis.AAC.1
MFSTLPPLSKKVLRRSLVPTERRVVFAQAYLLSKGLQNACCWPALNASESSAVHSAVMRVYKSIYTNDAAAPVSDEKIISELGVMSPNNLVRFSRLALFTRCSCKLHPPLLKALYAARKHKRSWLQAVLADVRFLSDATKQFEAMGGCNLSE